MSSKNKVPAKKSKPASSKRPAKKPAKKPVRALKGKSKPKPKKKSPLRKSTVQAKAVQPKVSFLFTDQGVTVNFPWNEGERSYYRTKTVLANTKEFDDVRTAVRANDMAALVKIVTRTERIVQRNIARFREKHIELRDNGQLLIDGRELPMDLGKRIVTYSEEGLPYDSLVKFWRKLVKNPSHRAVSGLFRFLDANHFPITDEGNFIAYKGVRDDWLDCHSGTMDNSVGKTVKMLRNMVDEDPAQACSSGLHVASYDYAHKNYDRGQGHTVMVSVDPANVVAVPFADDDQKMRVCEYTVLAESSRELREHVVSETNLPTNNNDNYENIDDFENNDNDEIEEDDNEDDSGDGFI